MLASRPQSELDTILQIKKYNGTVVKLLPDNSLCFKFKSVAQNLSDFFKIIYAYCENCDARFHKYILERFRRTKESLTRLPILTRSNFLTFALSGINCVPSLIGMSDVFQVDLPRVAVIATSPRSAKCLVLSVYFFGTLTYTHGLSTGKILTVALTGNCLGFFIWFQ